MMIYLKEENKQHLKFLILQPPAVLKDFCKSALDFLKNGPNPKLYQLAAQKLEVQPEIVQSSIEGLVNLLVESCKHELSDLDFRDSILTLGFTEEQQEILGAFYEEKKTQICNVLSQLSLDLPHYSNLEWRFDVQVASRSLLEQVTPLITINLGLKTSNKDSNSAEKTICLQTDPTNLLHITQVLEDAVTESRSQLTRKMQRILK